MAAARIDAKVWGAYAFRALLLVVLPFSLGMWMLPHTQALDSQSLGAPVPGGNAGASNLTFFGFAHRADASPQRVNALFPLANYVDFPPFVSHDRLQECFADTGSRFVWKNSSTPAPEVVWKVSLETGVTLRVEPNSINCTDIDLSQPIQYKWVATLSEPYVQPYLDGNLTFEQSISAYPRIIIDYGLLQGLSMIPVFYLLIFYPAVGIWKKLHKGMLEQ